MFRGETLRVPHPHPAFGAGRTIEASFDDMQVLVVWTKDPALHSRRKDMATGERYDAMQEGLAFASRRAAAQDPVGVLANVAATGWGGTTLEPGVPTLKTAIDSTINTLIPWLERMNKCSITEAESPLVQWRWDPIIRLRNIATGAWHDPLASVEANNCTVFHNAMVRLICAGVRDFHFSFLQPFAHAKSGKPRGQIVDGIRKAGFEPHFLSLDEQVEWFEANVLRDLDEFRSELPGIAFHTCTALGVQRRLTGVGITHGACVGAERVQQLCDDVGISNLRQRLVPGDAQRRKGNTINRGDGGDDDDTITTGCLCVAERDFGSPHYTKDAFKGTTLCEGESTDIEDVHGCAHKCAYCFVMRPHIKKAAAAAL